MKTQLVPTEGREPKKAKRAKKGPNAHAADFGRPIVIHCCKDGTITYRAPGEKVFNGVALPVFSVDTEEEAQSLQVRHCRLQYGEHPLMSGKPWYRFNDFSGTLEDLARVTTAFRASHKQMQKPTP